MRRRNKVCSTFVVGCKKGSGHQEFVTYSVSGWETMEIFDMCDPFANAKCPSIGILIFHCLDHSSV